MMEQVSDIDHGKANEVVRAHAVDDASHRQGIEPHRRGEKSHRAHRTCRRRSARRRAFRRALRAVCHSGDGNLPSGVHELPAHSSALSASRSESRRCGGFDFDGRRRHALVSGEQDAEERQSHFHRRRVSQLAPALLGLQCRSRLVAPPASTLGQLVKKAKSSEQVAANRGELRTARCANVREQHESLFRQIERRGAESMPTTTPIDPRWAVPRPREALPGQLRDLRRDHRLSRLDPGNDSAQTTRNPISRGSPAGSASVLSYALGVKLSDAGPAGIRAHRRWRISLQCRAVLLGRRGRIRLADPLRGVQQRPLSVDGNKLDQIFPRRRGENTPAFISAPTSRQDPITSSMARRTGVTVIV